MVTFDSVKLLEKFNDKLPSANSNKLFADLRGICLKSLLFDRAFELCSGIPVDMIESEGTVAAIFSSVHKRDALTAVCEMHQDFSNLLTIQHKNSESFKNLEARFAAQVAKYNAHCETIHVPESIIEMVELIGLSIDDAKHVPILVAT